MTALEGALIDVASALESLSIPYTLIGGLAVSLWDEARATLDADVLIWVEPDCIDRTVANLQARLALDPRDPAAFVRDTRVLPARSSQGVRIDIVFGALPWEKEAIARAHSKEIAGRAVRVASVEDLSRPDILETFRKHAGLL